MEEKGMKTINMLALTFGIALMSPIQAVPTSSIGVGTRAVALIRAGLFVASGNRRQSTFKISLDFLLGDLRALTVVRIMEILPWNLNVGPYLTLFVLGGVAVIVGKTLAKVIYTPAWLCGWIIGLTIMGPVKVDRIGTLPVQIGIAMLVGATYVGAGVDAFQKMMVGRLMRW